MFGRNVYTKSIIEHVSVAGVIDDFTDEKIYCGVPVIKTEDLPPDALVVAASGGKPLTVAKFLDGRGIDHIDYFAFLKHANLPLRDVVFNEGFNEAVAQNPARVEWLRGLMADPASSEVLDKLLGFRSTLDLAHLDGFIDRQPEQYFEPFLALPDGAVFWDIGGFDGYTSQEFAKRFPSYDSVKIFEPEPDNQENCRKATENLHDVEIMPYGAGSENGIARFSSDGSASTVVADGEIVINIRKLDEFGDVPPTFLKMDIEGAEIEALKGAELLITKHRPTLAISVYHRPSDFWNVPELVLSFNPNYRIYLRHYTESIYETVMYFIPT